LSHQQQHHRAKSSPDPVAMQKALNNEGIWAFMIKIECIVIGSDYCTVWGVNSRQNFCMLLNILKFYDLKDNNINWLSIWKHGVQYLQLFWGHMLCCWQCCSELKMFYLYGLCRSKKSGLCERFEWNNWWEITKFCSWNGGLELYGWKKGKSVKSTRKSTPTLRKTELR